MHHNNKDGIDKYRPTAVNTSYSRHQRTVSEHVRFHCRTTCDDEEQLQFSVLMCHNEGGENETVELSELTCAN